MELNKEEDWNALADGYMHQYLYLCNPSGPQSGEFILFSAVISSAEVLS